MIFTLKHQLMELASLENCFFGNFSLVSTLPQKPTNSVSDNKSHSVIMSISDAKNESSSVSDGSNDSKSKKPESVESDPLPLNAEVSAKEAAVFKLSDLVPKTDEKRPERNNRDETCSKMEKNLQDTSLKLQNLYDNLESLRLDSNMYFCKLIDFLDS